MHFFWSSASGFEKFIYYRFYYHKNVISFLYESDSFSNAVMYTYFAILAILSFYGLHRYMLVWLACRHRNCTAVAKERFQDLPFVTVQLPFYNEMYVVQRLIDAACAFDYPRDRFEIQLLDDSTDETQKIARTAAEEWRRRGIDVHYVHRENRSGFKAGALENGLKTARGEFIAIFDADFVPQPDFLQKTIHHFTDPKVGVVQGRWEHINRDYSFLTRAQAILLDGHFIMESNTRFLSGRFFNFNGTAGILRRKTIEEAGGWEHDTLTEDLDLSYRAQMKGWKFIFLPDVPVPAELPVEINSFKAQQCRWAKGAMQTGKKVLPRLLRGNFSPAEKLEAWYHLTANVCYPLMILLAVMLFPALIVRFNQGWFELVTIDLPLFLLSFASVNCFYIVAQRRLHKDWYKRILYLPGLMALGIGMTVAVAKAVVEGAVGVKSPFVRTPKFSVEGSKGDWKRKKYRGRMGLLPFIEIGLGCYFSYVNFYAWSLGIYGVIPFLFLFQFGYLYTGLGSLIQGLKKMNLPMLRSPLRFRLVPSEEELDPRPEKA
jgi:cellulose synthase/poly-beta-1,6-N-acetylglucosamine synthase-like glycosyltransferase